MAPEMLNCNDIIKYNHKVDIWALGCIVYELCTLNPYININDIICSIINNENKSQIKKINLNLYDIKL